MLEITETKDKRKEFLDRFTEELIITTALLLKERIKFEKELARAKRNVEIEKLRQKFNKYGEKVEKKEEIKTEPQVSPVQPLIIRPLQRPPMMRPRRIVQQPEKPVQLMQKPAAKPVLKQTEPRKAKEMPITAVPIPARQPPVNPGEINFEKLMFLVKDPSITYIECPGIEKNVIIKRAGMTLKTQIKLIKDEILRIIKSFSEIARIPLIEGMLTARIQNLEISAIVSEKGQSSFIIRKILIDVKPFAPSILAQPSMPGAIAFPTAQKFTQPMPPVNRPFTPGAIPNQQNQKSSEAKREESFWNKKITIGK